MNLWNLSVLTHLNDQKSRKAIKFFKCICLRLLFLSIIFSSVANAYDIDTHFYGTYLFARWAGLNHSIASRLALNSQWIDESIVTTPMGAPAYFGVRARRLNHFPTQATKAKGSSAHGVAKFSVFGEAEPNHPMASMYIAEGMKKGQLWMVGAGLHVLADSFGHAGFSILFGHGEHGHSPDRFYFEPKKFRVMVHRMFTAIVAIRMALPENALDQNMVSYKDSRLQMSAFELANSLLSTKEVDQLIETNFLQHQEYVREAVRFTIMRLEESGYFYSNVNSKNLIPEADSFYHGKSVLEALSEIFKTLALRQRQAILQAGGKNLLDVDLAERLLQERGFNSGVVLNIKKIIQDTAPGLPFGIVPIEEIANNMKIEEQILHEDLKDVLPIDRDTPLTDSVFSSIIEKMIKVVLVGQIPQKFSSVHKSEFEHDGLIRAKEMEIRIRAFQDIIEKMFNVRPRFKSESVLKMAKRFLSRSSESAGPESIEQGLRELNIRMSNADQVRYLYGMGKILFSIGNYYMPMPWYTLYQYPEKFKESLASGFFKPLATRSQVESWIMDDQNQILRQQKKSESVTATKLSCFRIF